MAGATVTDHRPAQFAKTDRAFTLAVDFDGTVVEHQFPRVGPDIPFAAHCLRQLVDEHGIRIVLWTCRSGTYLDDAVRWFAERDIPLWGVNANLEQHAWSSSPKAFAHLYVDDMALGVPLLPAVAGRRRAVDWQSAIAGIVERILQHARSS